MPKIADRALTDMAVAKAKPSVARREIPDAAVRGLYLVVQPSGSKAWAWRGRIDGKPVKITLGSYPALGLAAARTEAARLSGILAAGGDPKAERFTQLEEAERSRRETLKAIAESYLHDRGAELRPRTIAEVRRHLEVHWRTLHHRPLRQITRREIAARLLELKTENGPVAANRARASLSALFTWAVAHGLAEDSPVRGTAKAAERARERVLTLDELREVWAATGGDHDYDRIVRMLLITGQRRDEVGAMRWAEIIDLDGAEPTWIMSGTRTKNGREHRMPLSPVAVGILRAQRERRRRVGDERPPYVFGEKPGRPFSGWSRCKSRLDDRLLAARLTAAGVDRNRITGERIAMLGMPAWAIHDLRRSVATHMAEHGIAAPHCIEALLNHVSGHKGGVAGIYNRALYSVEVRAAVRAWADLLGRVESRKIVSLCAAS